MGLVPSINKSLLLLALIVTVSGCSGTDATPELPLTPQGQPVVSDQFTEEELVFDSEEEPVFMVLLKLKTPPLLSNLVESEDGSLQVDPELKERLSNEQEAFIAELEQLSPSIKVLFRYERVLNALAVQAPQSLAGAITQLNVEFIEAVERFARPDVTQVRVNQERVRNLLQNNSVTFLGVDRVQSELSVDGPEGQSLPVRGQGVRVGIIDSGIDYTHQAMMGPGVAGLSATLNPNEPNSYFPNEKVVGGYDFAGQNFNPGSHLYSHRLAQPDPNPLDLQGHGTHVAGTVAGIGDGVNTYDGVAPEAQLYALKVFGDGEQGGTMDSLVIAALEYSVDPNQDYKFDDRLHVVNLSLGGNFGKPHTLYAEAIRNITEGGVVVVAAAGNSGPISSIVGAPSTVEEALSVAASVDGSNHIWQFPAVEFSGPNDLLLKEEAVEGQTTRPLETLSSLQAPLVYIGLAAQDLSPEVAESVRGKVALIDRGEVAFDEKLSRAQAAGALGVVMVNNEPGNPFIMAGSISYAIPGVMITQPMGQLIKRKLAQQEEIVVNFKPANPIEKPEIIDTIASFSSQGPRDLDALIKPEVSAPGFAIISADAGAGNGAALRYGTSMAAPHVAGVAALAVQYRKDLNAKQIKSLLMNTAQRISDEESNSYPISRQGAGRIQAFEALTSPVAILTPAISLGKIAVRDVSSKYETLRLQNISSTAQTFTLNSISDPHLTLGLSPRQLTLEPGEIAEVQVVAHMEVPEDEWVELDGFIQVLMGEQVVSHVPVMAVVNRTTLMGFDELTLVSNSINQTSGALALASVSNQSVNDGMALLFNLLGKDERKPNSPNNDLSVACDLQSAGYRVIERRGAPVLQFAVKLYNPVTSWFACDVSVDFDLNGDQVPDKELNGTITSRIPGLQGLELPAQTSILFNSQALMQIYQEYSEAIANQPSSPPSVDFRPAIEQISPFIGFHQSTIALVETPLRAFGGASSVAVRVSVSFNGSEVVMRDDVLQHENGQWKEISLVKENQPYYDMPEFTTVGSFGGEQIPLKRGTGRQSEVIAYFPRNEFILETLGFDSQSQVQTPRMAGGSVHP
jgi:minor extracellular serine protease Vpr